MATNKSDYTIELMQLDVTGQAEQYVDKLLTSRAAPVVVYRQADREVQVDYFESG